MVRCRLCGEDGLKWEQISGKWVLFGGKETETSGRHICQKSQPIMGRKEKRLAKDLDSRRLKLIGFRFNNSNLADGLVHSILSGEYPDVST